MVLDTVGVEAFNPGLKASFQPRSARGFLNGVGWSPLAVHGPSIDAMSSLPP